MIDHVQPIAVRVFSALPYLVDSAADFIDGLLGLLRTKIARDLKKAMHLNSSTQEEESEAIFIHIINEAISFDDTLFNLDLVQLFLDRSSGLQGVLCSIIEPPDESKCQGKELMDRWIEVDKKSLSPK